MKKLCTLFLTLFVASSVWAVIINGIDYSLNNDTRTASVCGVEDKKISSISIPSTVYYSYGQTTYDVVSIGKDAFKDCSNLTSVTIPNSVTSIGNGAFSRCSSLTSVTIPNSVTLIGNSAFSGCSSLTSVTIPNSVTYLSGFSGCTGLTSITIPNSVTSIGEYAFQKCSLKSITIPSSVTNIGRQAFDGNHSMTSVVIEGDIDVSEGSLDVLKDSLYFHVLITPKSKNPLFQIEKYIFGQKTEAVPIELPLLF